MRELVLDRLVPVLRAAARQQSGGGGGVEGGGGLGTMLVPFSWVGSCIKHTT